MEGSSSKCRTVVYLMDTHVNRSSKFFFFLLSWVRIITVISSPFAQHSELIMSMIVPASPHARRLQTA